MIVKSELMTKEQVLEHVYPYAQKVDCFRWCITSILSLDKVSSMRLSDTVGLCGSVFKTIDNRILHTIFNFWPHFSNNKVYPIPPTHPEMTVKEAYDYAFHTDSMLYGKYGQLRIDLYEFTFAALKTIAEIYEENKSK